MSRISGRLPRYFVLCVAAALYLLLAIFIVLRLSNPSDGTRLGLRADNIEPGAVVVHPIAPQPDGLQEGDHVIRINGEPLSVWADTLFNVASASPNWTFNETLIYKVVRNNQTLDVRVNLGHFPIEGILRDNFAIFLFVVALQAEAVWIFACRPDERLAQILLLAVCATVTYSIGFSIGTDLVTLVSFKVLWLYYRFIVTFGTAALLCSLLLHFSLILPRQYSGPIRDFRVVCLIYILPYPVGLGFVASIYTANTLEWLRRGEIGSLLIIAGYFIAVLVALGTSYYRLKDPLERKRVGTLALAFSATTLLMLVLGWLPAWTMQQPVIGWSIVPLFALPIAVGLAIAVVLYQLLDIKVLIQRTLVWGTLTLVVIALYAAVVGFLSILFQSQGNALFSLVATGLAALLFQPVRERVQGGVTHLLYGERDAPYEVMAQLTSKLEATPEPQLALHTIVQTIVEALKVSYAAIELCYNHQSVLVTDYGNSSAVGANEWVEFELKYGSEVLGRLVVAPRLPGELLTPGDRRLILGLVHHAQVTIETVRLTADLQRSREKLVLAREEERRRLRRDLHDGLGPAIASLTLQIDTTRSLLNQDVGKADALLLGLKSQVQTTLTEIRRLAYELRPPALDELGLIGALNEKARQLRQSGQMVVTIDAPVIPPLPAAVESAAYRIVLEALTNAARHAKATTCHIRVDFDDRLCLEVRDNGQGLPDNHQRGVGINSMQERASELGGKCVVDNAPGGGTLVLAWLPVAEEFLTNAPERKVR